ncbi:MAG: hypothetical protein AABX01_07165 [Candidatus Micrarchaeota archaeon]
MKRRERILEMRKIFKQKLLRPLAAMMYFEMHIKEKKIEEGIRLEHFERQLLEKLTLESNAFHDFLQSHEFSSRPKLSNLILQKLISVNAAIKGLRARYIFQKETPELFDAMARGIKTMMAEIEKFEAFEERNRLF